MHIYLDTYDEAVLKAEELAKFHGGHYAGNSSILCPHGRSRSCVVFSKSFKILYNIIVCDKCRIKNLENGKVETEKRRESHRV